MKYNKLSNEFAYTPGNWGFSSPFSILTVFPQVNAQRNVLKRKKDFT